jgi:hypothetical protein
MLLAFGPGGARAAAAGDAVLEARMLPPTLATDVVSLRALPASAAALDPGITLERTEPYYSEEGQVLTFAAKNRGAVLVGRSTRLAILADDVVLAAAAASPSGWGIVFGYEGSKKASGRSYERIDYSHDSWKTTTDQRYQLGAGWRAGNEATRAYEIGLLGSLYESGGDDTGVWAADSLKKRVDWRRSGRHDLGLGLTIRTLSAREGPQLGLYFLYEDPRPSIHHAPRLHQRQREVRIDGAWRVRGTRLDDLVVGASLLWGDQTTLVAWGYGSRGYESEIRETVYTGIAFVSIEETIVPGLVLRAGARAPAQIGTEGERRVQAYADGGYGPISGTEETEGSVREAEIAVGLGGRWRRFLLDGQLRSSLDIDGAVLRWSLTVLL